VIQSAGPSPALLERLKHAAACMGIHDQAAETDTPEPNEDTGVPKTPDETESPQPKEKTRRASYLWAMLIARIYEALPLLCPRCGSPMKITAVCAALEECLVHHRSRVPVENSHASGCAHKASDSPPGTSATSTGFRVHRSGAALAVTSRLVSLAG
jgi:hypothetical protein